MNLKSDKGDTGKEKLLDGITAHAKMEAERILSDSQKYMDGRKEDTAVQISKIRKEAEAKAKIQIEAIEKGMESSVYTETKRIGLQIRNKIFDSVQNKIQEKLNKIIKSDGYRKILSDWIVEASIGLNVKEAYVNASVDECNLIDTDLLNKAEEDVFKLTGKKIKLNKAESDPLLVQGIVLYSDNGKTAFNNQVPVRIQRYKSDIRKKIYEKLFKEEA